MVEGLTETSTDAPPAGTLANTDYHPEPTIQWDAFCDGENGVWTARVTSATFTQRQRFRFDANEITLETIDAADCDRLYSMAEHVIWTMSHVTDLWSDTPQDIIHAHEDVHRDITSEDVPNVYEDFVSEIEAITVPCEGYNHREAVQAMLASAGAAILHFTDARIIKDNLNGLHAPLQRFLDAQRPLAQVWYDIIKQRWIDIGCPGTLPAPPD